ncbi:MULTISPECIES: type II toxin-antitoxin system VapC family toxin [unclassified Sphingobium]|jgi:PIN domain nuclease of toxin-antitoxin system|uniref:type II toxin-antitoxin system VapC family toxin n=1 Tax=unclassified Sphingobium TaxID=2611147 RepID=UPI0022EF22AD|nr:type II toxin-antitoxin system VapC family toxin [Sphingobium sp. BS19]GLI98807.1 hypothetical protein Sbs19_26250 [Sphingobium sp. BS19]
MASVVFDASALLALLRDEPGADVVASHMGDGLISAVNLQEVIKALLRRGIGIEVVREMIDALHLDVRPHKIEDAFAAGELYLSTEKYGSGLGDRSCMALAISEKLPALTADKEWSKVKVKGLKVMLVR